MRPRVAVVSGGGTGIGRAIAVRLAEAGVRVAVLGRRSAPLEGTGALVRRAHVDLGDGSADPDPVHAVAADLTRPAEAAAAWESDWRTNVLTAVLLTTALVPEMADGTGRIINISSLVALRGGGASYAAAKAALHGWTFGLATDLAPRGITANVVAPGFVEGTEFFGDTMADARRARLVAQVPLGRPGTPTEVADLVTWLASTESSLVTGQIVKANGGTLAGR